MYEFSWVDFFLISLLIKVNNNIKWCENVFKVNKKLIRKLKKYMKGISY